MAVVFFLVSLAVTVLAQRKPPEAYFYGIDRAISEDTPIGTLVFYINASDPNGQISNPKIILSSNNFYLMANGSVQLIKRLNYELETTAPFDVTVFDGFSSTHYSKVMQIEDVNDNPPRFSQSRYQTSLPEDALIGRLVFDVTITDVDINNAVLDCKCVYNPATPDACNTFSVNKTSASNKNWVGKIFLKKQLDYEDGPKIFQLLLQALDGNSAHNSSMTFEITVTNVHDTPPLFVGSFNQVTNENVPIGTFIITVVAIDRELEKRPIRYELSYNPGGFFTIDSISGNITTSKMLDRESLNSPDGIVILTVMARELLQNGSLGDDNLTKSSSNITITVLDVNDNPPQFAQTHYSVNVSEAIQNGQGIPGLLMSVTDKDSGSNAYYKFVFSGLKNYGDVFEVSPPEAQGSATATLIVRNSSALDYDRGIREFTVEVIAREVQTTLYLSSTAAVTIYLIDANDNSPVFQTDKVTIGEVSELTKPGEIIYYLPQATDVDTGAYGTAGIRYFLIGNGISRFDLDPLSAVLRLGNCSKPGVDTCLDYESVTQYSLFLVAADNNGKGLETRLPINLSIKDENDNPPEFTSNLYQYSVAEETTVLTTNQRIAATDIDSSRNGNNRVRFSIISDQTGLFSIDAVTADLKIRRPILFKDGDRNGRIRITVAAGNLLDSSAVIDFTSSVPVDIIIQDINNNAPSFPRNYSASVQESITPGIEIITVKAEDADFGENALIEYSIISGGEDTFQIDRSSGVMSRRYGSSINYNSVSRYNITVKATDRGVPRLSGITQVAIYVIRPNNRIPVFNPPVQHANVSEGADVDFLITSMVVTEIDESAALTFTFVEPITAYNLLGQIVENFTYDYRSLFRIDSRSGEVRVNRKLEAARVQKVIYSVQVIDSSVPDSQRIGKGMLTINIITANNHAPEYQGSLVGSVSEEQPIGSVVMILNAKDGDGDLVMYELLHQSLTHAFYIQPTTGVVTINSRIDYEVVQLINITVRASDNGSPPRYTDRAFTVNVINVNDNLPIFSKAYYEGEISENSTDRQTVTSVSAADADLQPYGDVKYRLPDDITKFRIDETSGVITKLPGVTFDRETAKEISFPVIAYDGPGTPSRTAMTMVYVTLKDVNDNSPFFIEKDVYVTLSSDLPVGSFVTRQVALDRDIDDLITYSISNDTGGRYAISQNGNVTTRIWLTYAPDHSFDIIAADRAGHSAFVRVHVTILGNKQPPIWRFPAFDGDKLTICENRDAGFAINTDQPVAAKNAVKYGFYVNNQWTQDFGDLFRMSSTGIIYAKKTLDRESQNFYLVLVAAMDAYGLMSLRYLLIRVCDMDDSDPEFPAYSNGTVKSYYFQIEEDTIGCVRDPQNRNQCGKVIATDLDLPENGQILYSISGENADLFSINEMTGVISTLRGLDIDNKALYKLVVTANNFKMEDGQKIVRPNKSMRGVTHVYISVTPKFGNLTTLIGNQENLYAPIDSPVGLCLTSVRPYGLSVVVRYAITSQTLYFGNQAITEVDGKNRFSIGENNGRLCIINVFNPSNKGGHYELNITAISDTGVKMVGVVRVWLTDDTHRIRVLVDAGVNYAYENRQAITNALQTILGSQSVVWIDSIGHYSVDQQVSTSKSEVVIYAVDLKSRNLYTRSESIVYINQRVMGEYKAIALSVNIAGAADMKTNYQYIYLGGGSTAALVGGGGGGIPAGLLAAMILLLPLLLIPFLLCCLPCCAPLLAGGRKGRYAYVKAPEEDTYIDNWYKKSELYNNPAYVGYSDNWDSGSSHMLVMPLSGDKASAASAAAKGSTQVVEETEEVIQQSFNDSGKQIAAQSDAFTAGKGLSNQAYRSAEGMVGGSVASQNLAGGKTHVTNNSYHTIKSASMSADTAVIVDTLTPTAPQVSEEISREERIEKRSEEKLLGKERVMEPLPQLPTSEQIHVSSLSPSTTDMLDSASVYNARMSSGPNTSGNFSHTAIVSRHGNQSLPPPPPVREEYYNAESYESDYHTDQRPHHASKRFEDTEMTIILDAQPTRGLEVEEAEYEIISDDLRTRPFVAYEHSSVIRDVTPNTGFTIELEPNVDTSDGIAAEREEYILENDDGLSPEFFEQAQRSLPASHRKYKKTTTRRVIDDDYYD